MRGLKSGVCFVVATNDIIFIRFDPKLEFQIEFGSGNKKVLSLALKHRNKIGIRFKRQRNSVFTESLGRKKVRISDL